MVRRRASVSVQEVRYGTKEILEEEGMRKGEKPEALTVMNYHAANKDGTRQRAFYERQIRMNRCWAD